MPWILGLSALTTKQFNRRQFLLLSSATVSTTLLKACTKNSLSAQNPIDSDTGETSLPLKFISVPPATGQAPTALIVCLHGFGGKSQELAPFAPVLNLPDYQFFFPDAPYPHPSVSGGRMWYNLQSSDEPGLISSRQQLTDWLKSLEASTGVPLSRTILSGFSQGGAMTLDVGLTLPVAGLVSLSGYMHPTPNLSGKSLPPVLIVHGRQDQVVSLSAAQRARDRLSAAGAAVNYQEFNIGHEITPEVLALVRSFIVDII